MRRSLQDCGVDAFGMAAAAEHRFLDLAKNRQWDRMMEEVTRNPSVVNVQPCGRWSALHQAAGAGNADVVGYLLACRADVHARTSSGQTAAEIAGSVAVRGMLAEGAVARAQQAGSSSGQRTPVRVCSAERVAGSDKAQMTPPARSVSLVEVFSSDDEGAPANKRPRVTRDILRECDTPMVAPMGSRGVAGTLATKPSSTTSSTFSCTDGFYQLSSSSGFVRKGAYAFNAETRRLCNDAGEHVGTFTDDAVSMLPLLISIIKEPSTASDLALKCVSVIDGEIMEEIQKPSNAGAFFVLPSQLNGAEYPSHKVIVNAIDQYTRDNTGGPRGQLAVHPAAGQFVLDNAACDRRLDGINAADVFLSSAKNFVRSCTSDEYDIHLRNGYLAVPDCPPGMKAHVLQGLRAALHNLRCLCMHDVPACGLAPSFKEFSTATHRVSLVYASAVPVQAYLNRENRDLAFQEEVGRLVILGQYYGALRLAAQRDSPRTRIVLMPLGGGVFNNRPAVIMEAMSTAIELLAKDGVNVYESLDIRLLTFRGNPTERARMEGILRSRGGGKPPFAPTVPSTSAILPVTTSGHPGIGDTSRSSKHCDGH